MHAEGALRFDYAETRCEIRAPGDAAAALLATAPALSETAGCPAITIANM